MPENGRIKKAQLIDNAEVAVALGAGRDTVTESDGFVGGRLVGLDFGDLLGVQLK